VAGCYLLTFRAVARASRVSWTWLRCQVSGTLDSVDKAPQFTDVELRVRLCIPPTMDQEQARRALEKAERLCLISRSLKATTHLTCAVEIDDLVVRPETATGARP